MASKTKKESAETFVKWIGALVAVGGLVWGVASFLITARIQAETRQLEVRKPFLERQLALYNEATQVAAVLATSDNSADLQTKRQRFWELYWGELALVENGGLDAAHGGVESAMAALGACLNRDCAQNELRPLALQLAHACRDSLAISWGVQDWKSPTYNKPRP